MRILSVNAWGGAMYEALAAYLAQAERLAEVVDSMREPEDVVVVCGDLNVLPDSEIGAQPEVSDHRVLLLDL